MNLNKIKQPFTEIFPGDFSGNLMQRQTPGFLFATVSPENFERPELLIFNDHLSQEIGLGKIENQTDKNFLAAQNLPENIKPYATAYAGHQFGNWAGQLGDGRAILAGEITNSNGEKTELQWKGAGATPYSRSADGKAVLRSSIREYLMSEAMHHLRVPTTRALSLSLTGEGVVRDINYSGNPAVEKGAVVMRTAESFLRFGHFELLSARKELDTLKKLADFSIENYFPEIQSKGKEKYAEWFENICERTVKMIVGWCRTGFVHGVMNTDNMSILGLTIDYGPFSMMDEYDLDFTPNTTDLPGKRYAFGKQAQIAHWNLAQLANAIYPLINEAKPLETALDNFGKNFWQQHDEMLASKFGFDEFKQEDEKFFLEWQQLMQNLNLDHTLFFNQLETFDDSKNTAHFSNSFYRNLSETETNSLQDFLSQYLERKQLNKISKDESLNLMKRNNPKFILRNYMLFECIQEVENGNLDLLNQFSELLKNPYAHIDGTYAKIRPEKYNNVVGCAQLSCSS